MRSLVFPHAFPMFLTLQFFLSLGIICSTSETRIQQYWFSVCLSVRPLSKKTLSKCLRCLNSQSRNAYALPYMSFASTGIKSKAVRDPQKWFPIWTRCDLDAHVGILLQFLQPRCRGLKICPQWPVITETEMRTASCKRLSECLEIYSAYFKWL